MSLNDLILQNFGGVGQNSLITSLESNSEDNEPDIINHSYYYDNDSLMEFMNEYGDSFTILSSNINFIHAKFDELETIIELYKTHGFQFSVMCFQNSKIYLN